MPFSFLGKTFYTTLLAILIIEILSYLSFLFTPINTLAFFIIIFSVLVVTSWQSKFGLLILLAELSIGGFGYLFQFQKISIRIGIFFAVILGFILNSIFQNNKDLLKLEYYKKFLNNNKIYFLFLFIIIFGLINGLIQNKYSNVLADINAWFFYLILPVFILSFKKEDLQNILQVLTASTLWLSIKTIILLFLFSHQFTQIGDPIYRWVRDTRVGEITFISGSLFRIFLQSQIYCLIVLIILITYLFLNKNLKNIKNKYLIFLIIYFLSFSLVISQSRSFWLGGLTTVILLLMFALLKKIINLKRILLTGSFIFLVIVSQIFFIQIITGSLFGNRFKNLSAEPAGVSRINQLKPLTNAIYQNPIIGYGFGKTLTYQSKDPRIIKNNPDGWYTTYAFEWGYLDIILKIGLIGLIIYLIFLLNIFNQGNKIFNQNVLNYGFSFGLLALGIVNIFTPYLNHPLGIGFIILTTSIYGSQQYRDRN